MAVHSPRRGRPSSSDVPSPPERRRPPSEPASPPTATATATASASAPSPVLVPDEVPLPLRSVTARIPGELASEWDDRMDALDVPRQVSVAAALRYFLALDDGQFEDLVKGESYDQRKQQARRRRAST